MPIGLRRLLREPLVHFLLLGGALFLLWHLVGTAPRAVDETIEIGEAEVESLVESWTSVWQRPPEPGELRDLVDDYVREEILFREAVALGLHRGDPMIRRRLAQKMELLGETVGDSPTPSDAELEAFLEDNPQLFERQARISFRHVYFDPQRRGASIEEDAAAALDRLRGSTETVAGDLGDPLALPGEVGLMRAGEIRRLFGSRFVDAVATLPIGRWEGPIESDLGTHLVRVGARREARRPSLEEVRERVESEWLAARQRRARQRQYEALRQNYDVEIIDLEAFLERRDDRSSAR